MEINNENINANPEEACPQDARMENTEYPYGRSRTGPLRDGYSHHERKHGRHEGNEKNRCGNHAHFYDPGYNPEVSGDTVSDDIAENRGWKMREWHGREEREDNNGPGRRRGSREGWNYSDPDAENDLGNMLKKCTDYIYRGEGRRGGQEKILKLLAHNGDIPQRKLQEILNIKSSSISEILSKMEENGLIERIRFEDDKRRTSVRITEQGLQKLREGKKTRETYDPFAALDDAEKDSLKCLLKKLLSSWKPAD